MPRPKKENAKNTRFGIVIQAELKEKIKKIATMQRKTMNGLICDVLASYASKHKAEIEKYKATFENEE